jgi:hypothetical protein
MNRATRIIVSTFGVILGIAGMNHGFFEVLQGNTPTNAPAIIQAIGKDMQWWIHGGEEAFTIIPNFLLTGLLAMLVSLTIIIWSIWFIDRKYGSTVFILLFVLLFLVGGGIGQIVFFIPAWLASTRINKPLTWWRKVIPTRVRPWLAKIWPGTLTIACISFLIALEIAIFGYVPGVRDPDARLGITWSLLGICWILMMFSFVAGFAHDIEDSKHMEGGNQATSPSDLESSEGG